MFRWKATTHKNAGTVGKTILARHNSRFHSIRALEMDSLPWESKHKQAVAACTQAIVKKTIYAWEKSYFLKIVCVIGFPSLYGRDGVSYIASRYVLGDIIQPAGDGSMQIITGTGVYFISTINALEWWYSTPRFDSFCFLSFPPPPSGTIKSAVVVISMGLQDIRA